MRMLKLLRMTKNLTFFFLNILLFSFSGGAVLGAGAVREGKEPGRKSVSNL